jgi:hypothetical protein
LTATGELAASPPPASAASAAAPVAPAGAGGVTALGGGLAGGSGGSAAAGSAGTGTAGTGTSGNAASNPSAAGPAADTPEIRTGGPLPRRPGGPAIRGAPMSGDPRTGLLGGMDISAECRELSRERDPDCRGSRLYEPGRNGPAIPAQAPPPSNIPRPSNPLPRCPPGTPQAQFGLSCLPPLDEPSAPKL